jgi:hypothetical protein
VWTIDGLLKMAKIFIQLAARRAHVKKGYLKPDIAPCIANNYFLTIPATTTSQ